MEFYVFHTRDLVVQDHHRWVIAVQSYEYTIAKGKRKSMNRQVIFNELTGDF